MGWALRPLSDDDRISFFQRLSDSLAEAKALPMFFVESVLREFPVKVLEFYLSERGISPSSLRAVEGPMEVIPTPTPWQEDLMMGGLDSLSFEGVKELTLPLSKVVPVQFLDYSGEGKTFSEAFQERRLILLCQLIMAGWKPGRPLRRELLGAVLRSNDELGHLPLVTLPNDKGEVLLLNGHHRIGTLIGLVGAGILPLGILSRIPFHQAQALTLFQVLSVAFDERETSSLPSFSWVDVMAFDSGSLERVKKLRPANLLSFGLKITKKK
jgi:hypothetical protein